jgi:nucleotide-binding universal stress UspA family protein
MEATLICAYVEPLQRGVFDGAGGTMLAVPVDTEEVPDPEPFPENLKQRVLEVVKPYAVECEFSRPVGEISIALGDLGESTGAHTIVVGTRKPGVRAGIAEFFAGSVAAHLTHRQPRPVLVVPVSPAAADESLPWDIQ